MSRPGTPKGPGRRIFTTDPADIAAGVFAELGRSNKYIRQHTGLSDGKIGYRLKWAGIKRQEYRDGTSATARAVMKTGRAAAEREVVRKVRKAHG